MSSTIQDDRSLLKAFALCVMRAIAKQHGGYLKVDHISGTVDFIVPAEESDAVAREVMERVGDFIL